MIFSVQQVSKFPGRVRNGANLRTEIGRLILSMEIGETIKVTMNGDNKIETFGDAMYKAARAVGCKIRGSVVKSENCVYIKRED